MAKKKKKTVKKKTTATKKKSSIKKKITNFSILFTTSQVQQSNYYIRNIYL